MDVENEKVKRPLSGFVLFCLENRGRFRIQFPDSSFGEMGKHTHEEWMKLSEADRERYNEKAKI
jgi:HMG (high mobility group) box